jgi:TPP-dependent pyruvate/acetoin dehydrogenase alpha subunit
MKNKRYISLYKKMLLVRLTEEKISNEYKFGKMRCPVHLSIGQEAPAAGICQNLKKSDIIVSAHRSHAHYLSKGGDLNKMIAEVYGKKTGCAEGKGGSMHLIDIPAGIKAAVPIVGSTIPIGTGLGWSIKLKNQKNKIVIIFFGDGATEEGVFQESIEFASLHKLKILFVCENNFYSVYSSLRNRQSKKRNLLKIAKSTGLRTFYTDGNKAIEIFEKSKKIINDIKKGKGPSLLLMNTYRWLEHCGPNNDDDLNYRSKTEVRRWLKKCPIKLIEKELINKRILSKKNKKNIKKNIIKKIEKSFDFAKKSNFPKLKDLNTHIYSD